MVVFWMHRTFFVFLKCTIQGGSKVDVLLIAFLHLWLKFRKGIDKYWIVPVRKLFYFHHWLRLNEFDKLTVSVQHYHFNKYFILHTNTNVMNWFALKDIAQGHDEINFLTMSIIPKYCCFPLSSTNKAILVLIMGGAPSAQTDTQWVQEICSFIKEST